MKLKEITITGFKSFNKKTTIVINSGISAIVGPNGSGKSNIVDAVRFVLGEQSPRSLRGTKSMTDLIFSGTKDIKPLNAASVSLLIDNSDSSLKTSFSEVEIKRKIYRNGENAYYINNSKVRLKDINDLFLDSGIGKNTFSIVGQGEVSRIIMSSPEDRRLIIEGAAGVLKYKVRKEESLKMLSKVEDNLNRLRDLLSEVKFSKEKLEKERINALKYKSLKEKIKDQDISRLVFLIEKYLEEVNSLKRELSETSSKVIYLENEETNSFLKINKLKSEIDKNYTDLENINNKLINLNKELVGLKGSFNKENTNDEDKYLKARKDLNIINKEIEDLNNLLKLNNKTYKEKDISYKKLLNDINSKENSLREYSSSIISKELEINNLKSLSDNKNSYNKSIREIFNNPRLKVIDTINNIYTYEDYLEDVISASLSKYNQGVIVNNESDSKDIINYLKDNKLGRLTFYPINSVKERFVLKEYDNILNNHEGFIGVLSDLLEFDDKYYKVISNIAGSIIVAKTYEDATHISNKLNKKYMVISLRGDVINTSGTIVGGYLNNPNKNNRLKSLSAEKEELNNKVNKYKLIIDNLNKEKEEVEKEIFKLKSDIFRNKEELDIKNKNKEELENIINLYNTSSLTISDLKEKYYLKEEELETSERLKKDILFKIESSKEMLDELEGGLKKTKQDLSEEKLKLNTLTLDKNKKDLYLDTYLNELNENYNLTYERALSLKKDNFYVEETLRNLKTELNNLGRVNLLAIDEYEKVKARYEFLDKEQIDLLNSKDSLLKIIRDMDNTLEKEFIKTFDLLNEKFKKVFTSLFGGGEAELILTDPSNLLTSGVDIYASPPKKKLSSISLLSGGEKTLCAIALIFAILEIKETPFCLFDEVEAALDDKNVIKFSEMLKNYDTQFLIVTHKHNTMISAENLYGLSMEDGISKLISIKLT